MSTVDNLILIIASVAAWEFARLIARAVADMWDAFIAAREQAAINTANERAAHESMVSWLPTSASVARIMGQLERGELHVRAWPTGVRKRRLAAVVRDAERRAAA